MFPKIFYYLLNYFDANGFNSGLTKLSSSKKAIYIANIVQIAMAVFFLLFKIHMAIKFMASVRMIEVVNYVLQYSCPLYTYYAIILDTCTQKREHTQFWKFVRNIDEFYFPQNGLNLTNFFLKFLLCFFTSVLATSIVLLKGIVLSNNFLSEYENSIVFIFLVKICEARAFYYIFCLEILQY